MAATTPQVSLDLANLDQCFPPDFTEEQKAKAKTIFYKKVCFVQQPLFKKKIK